MSSDMAYTSLMATDTDKSSSAAAYAAASVAASISNITVVLARRRAANPNAGPSASHDNWLKEKIADGWTYGRVKNEAIKQHPCCVPYSKLPVSQRRKDTIFTEVVKTFGRMQISTLANQRSTDVATTE